MLLRFISVIWCSAFLAACEPAQTNTADTDAAVDPSALVLAVEQGDADSVGALLSRGADPNQSNSSGAPLLVAAALNKQNAVVEALLAAGADPNAQYPDYLNANALMVAVQNNDVGLARTLLGAGADVNVLDANNDPAINWAAYYGYGDLIDLFLENGATTLSVGHGSPREILMRRGHQALVYKLAAHDGLPEPDAATKSLISAIEEDDAASVAAALADGAEVDALDASGRPVLALAAREGKVTALLALLNAGATVDAPDQIGYTPLMEAAREAEVDAVKALVSAGANVNHAGKPNGLSLAVIHMAALGNSIEVATLVAGAGANLDAKGTFGGTAQGWAYGERKYDMVEALARLGADLTVKNTYGYSVADAIENQGPDQLKKLLNPE